MIEYDTLSLDERNKLDEVLKAFGVKVKREEYENYGFETVAIDLKPILRKTDIEYIDSIIDIFNKLPFMDRIESVAMECKINMDFEEFKNMVIDADIFFFGEINVKTNSEILDELIDCGRSSFSDFTSSAVQKTIDGYIIDLEDIPSYFGDPGMEMETPTSPISAIYTTYNALLSSEAAPQNRKKRYTFEKNLISFLKCIRKIDSKCDFTIGIGFPIY